VEPPRAGRHAAFDPRLVAPPLERLAALSEAEFRELFGDTPVSRARYAGFLRNVAVAMGNRGLARNSAPRSRNWRHRKTRWSPSTRGGRWEDWAALAHHRLNRDTFTASIGNLSYRARRRLEAVADCAAAAITRSAPFTALASGNKSARSGSINTRFVPAITRRVVLPTNAALQLRNVVLGPQVVTELGCRFLFHNDRVRRAWRGAR
jgi:hypothetical protein